jgi:hypothetical protein
MGASLRVEARLPGDVVLHADIPATDQRTVFSPGMRARFSWSRDSAVVLTD